MFTLQHWAILTFVFHGEIRGIRNYFLRSTCYFQVLRVKEELSTYAIFFFFFLIQFFKKDYFFWCVMCILYHFQLQWNIFLQPLSLVSGVLTSSYESNSCLIALGLSLGWREGKTFLCSSVILVFFFCYQQSHDSQLSFILHFTFDCSLLFLFILFCLFSFAPVFPAGGHLVCGEVRRPVTSQNIWYFSTPFLLSHLLLHFWQQWSAPVWKAPSLLPWWGQH